MAALGGQRACLLAVWLVLAAAACPVAAFHVGFRAPVVPRPELLGSRRSRIHSRYMVATGDDLNALVPPPPTDMTLQDEYSTTFPPIDALETLPSQQVQTFPFITRVLEEPSLNMGRALVLAAAAIYGTNFAAVKMLDESMPLAVSAALRFSLAAVAVGAAVLSSEKENVSAETKQERWFSTLAGMEVGAWYFIGYMCQAWGLQTADASKSAFFNALAVIVVPILDSFFRGIKMTSSRAASVTMAILGVGLLQLGPEALPQLTNGDLFCLGQALFFGIGYWRLESASASFPKEAARCTVGQLTAVALGSVTYMFLSSGLPAIPELVGWLTDGFIVKALLWTGLISTALALYLETLALKVVSASELTVLMTSISLWGSGFAFLTMGEMLSTTGLFGGLMILSGCILSAFGGDESEEAKLELEGQVVEPKAPPL